MRRSRAVYRRLLWLVPSGFRARFGTGMEDLFEYRLSRGRSGADRARIWIMAIADVLALAALERVRSGLAFRQGEAGMETGPREIRYALRGLKREPLLAGMAIATLALGIGASTATFSVVSTVLLEPLPYRDAGRLVAIWPSVTFNNAMVRETVTNMPAIEAAAGVTGWSLTLLGAGDPIQLDAGRVSPNLFRVLGAVPALGRDFTDEEGLPGRGDVVILSHRFWMRVFGGDRSVIGRRLQLSGAESDAHTVVGIMPADFHPIFNDPEVWIPLTLDPGATLDSDISWYVSYRVGRLAPGATIALAREQITRFAGRVREQLPRNFDDEAVRAATVEPLSTFVAQDKGPVLWAALAAVTLVLLIACANVANLLLARGDARAHEMALRAALGAGRRRLVRMVLAEGAVLGGVGGAIGVFASFGLVRLVTAFAPADFPRIGEVAVDAPVLAWAVAVSFAVTIIAGLIPALRLSRVDATAALAGATRTAAARRGSRLTLALVGVEVALAVIVTVGSGLMVRSLLGLTATDIGMDPSGVIVLQPTPPGDRYRNTQQFVRYFAEVMERVTALPQVVSVGGIHLLPGTRANWLFPAFPEGIDVPAGSPPPMTNFRLVQGDYFPALGLRPLRGRLLTPQDRADTEHVMIVNAAFAERYWPGLDPIGRTVNVMSARSNRFRVVGMVGDVRQHGFGHSPEPETYVPMSQWRFGTSLWLAIRVRSDDPMADAGAIQQAIWSVDPNVPISGLDELSSVFSRSAASTRFLTVVLGSFGVLALVLGAIGVFGVTSCAVGRRTSEFGVRIALGSSRASVLGVALLTCSKSVLTGLAVGLVAAVATTKVLTSVLYEVSPGDPLTLGLVASAILVIALLASALPAWRASRVDPVRVLNAG